MAGIILKADEQGVQIMNSMADSIEEASKGIISTCGSLIDDIKQYPALGPHQKQIEEMVGEIREEASGATAPAIAVAEKFRTKAQQYQEWINDDF